MNILIPVSLTLAISGYILGKIFSNSFKKIVNLINNILFYIIIPMVIFKAVYSATESKEFSLAVIISILHIIVIFILSYFTAYASGIRDKNELLSFSLSISMPNVAYLAIPLAIVLFNESKYVVPYTIAFNIILPVLTIVLNIIHSNNNKYNEKQINLIKSMPLIISLTISLILRFLGVELLAVLPIISMFTDAITPSSFVIIGYELSKISISLIKYSVKLIILSIVVKYVASPLIIIFQSGLINSFEYRRGLIFQSFMPPAISNIVLAKVFNLKSEIISMLIITLTPLSIAIVMLYTYLFIFA